MRGEGYEGPGEGGVEVEFARLQRLTQRHGVETKQGTVSPNLNYRAFHSFISMHIINVNITKL